MGKKVRFKKKRRKTRSWPRNKQVLRSSFLSFINSHLRINRETAI